MNQIETISDLVRQIQKDREDTLSGAITESRSRLAIGYDKLLVGAASLSLQYQRLERGKRPEKELRLTSGVANEHPKGCRCDECVPKAVGATA